MKVGRGPQICLASLVSFQSQVLSPLRSNPSHQTITAGFEEQALADQVGELNIKKPHPFLNGLF